MYVGEFTLASQAPPHGPTKKYHLKMEMHQNRMQTPPDRIPRKNSSPSHWSYVLNVPPYSKMFEADSRMQHAVHVIIVSSFRVAKSDNGLPCLHIFQLSLTGLVDFFRRSLRPWPTFFSRNRWPGSSLAPKSRQLGHLSQCIASITSFPFKNQNTSRV